MFLKIPPTSAAFFEASVTLSFQHHGLLWKWNSYSYYQPLRENNYQTANNLCIQEQANFVYYPPTKKIETYTKLFDTIPSTRPNSPIFSPHKHNTCYRNLIFCPAIAIPSPFPSSLFLFLSMTHSQVNVFSSSSYQTANKGPILRAASKGKFPPLDHTKWWPPRKGTDPLSHNFTVYCSLSSSGPYPD